MNGDRPYCLVLSGGGAKGVYHIGVRRALKELGIHIDAYIGNSIGAIISAFLVQGLDAELEELGENMTLGSIVDLGSAGIEEADSSPAQEALKRIEKIYRSLADKHGLDTTPLRAIIEKSIDEDAIRATGKDLGVTTVNVTDFKATEIFLDEMEPGSLIDYLMASSAIPGFALPEIKGKKYVDGGLYDNIPYEMALKRGYRRIIVVDISGAGMNRRANIEGTETVYIKNSIEMGGVLDFDRKFLEDYNRLGYLDTMRAFGKLAGYSYFIEPDGELEATFRQSLALRPPSDSASTRAPSEASRADPRADSLADLRASFRAAFPERMRHDKRLLMKLLECAAAALGIDRVREYGYRELAAAIAEKRDAENARIERHLAAQTGPEGEARRRRLDELVFEAVKARRFDGSPYYYSRIVDSAAPKRIRAVLERILEGFCPELPAGYLYFDLAEAFMREAMSETAAAIPDPAKYRE